MTPKRHPRSHIACEAPPEQWRVLTRNGNYSAFSGYRFTSSSYSALCCGRCGAHWRTKAAYTRDIRDATDGDRDLISRIGYLPKYTPAKFHEGRP